MEGDRPAPTPGQDPGEAVPAGVRALLLEHVDGFEKLEALVWLYRRRGQFSNAEQLAQELRVNTASLETALEQLAAARLLEREGSQYASPRSVTPHEASLQWLADAYASDRLSIIQLMTAQAIERIRSSTVRAFSEAFRIRKEPRG
jgi:hypothetical protein